MQFLALRSVGVFLSLFLVVLESHIIEEAIGATLHSETTGEKEGKKT